MLGRARLLFPTAAVSDTPAALTLAALRKPLAAQLDDMAQMIGRAAPLQGVGKRVRLSLPDDVFMRFFYLKKHFKRKRG